jgi:CheY-like chemotaxis protein
MDASGTARILLVENNPEWLDLIRQALPEYRVDAAQSYDEAVRRIGEGLPYDAAIVDLNLIDSPARMAQDRLGGEILLLLRQKHPLTRRLAITGLPPSAVREIFDRYDVDDLLIKANMTFSDLREVVEVSLARTAADTPAEVRARRLELWEDFRRWREDRTARFDEQARGLQYRLLDSGRLADRGAGKEQAKVRQQLAALTSQRAAFDRACGEVKAVLAGISNAGEVDLAARKFWDVRQEVDQASPVAEP